MFLVAGQHNVRPIVKQMLIGLDREFPENLHMIVSDYFFLVLPTSFYCAPSCIQHIWPCILL